MAKIIFILNNKITYILFAILIFVKKVFAKAPIIEPSTLIPSPIDAETALKTKIETVINLAVGIAGAIFVIMFIVGGVQYLASAGNEETSTRAKKILVDSIVGIVIIAVSYSFVRWLLPLIGLDIPSLIDFGP